MTTKRRQGGCHTDGSLCREIGRLDEGYYSGEGNLITHCHASMPDPSFGPARIIDAPVYPPIVQPTGLKEEDRDAVCYNNLISSPYPPTYGGGVNYGSPANYDGVSITNCGKNLKLIDCGAILFDFFPNGLSFQPMDSDTWFGYVYDMGINAGIIGVPCYHVTTEGLVQTGQATAEATKGECEQCSGFYCTPDQTYIRYTYNGPDETGDPDCPYPLVFAIGTDSNKVVFQYNELATAVPNGVSGLNFVYTQQSIDLPAWSNYDYSADPVTTNQMGWENSEVEFQTFEVFDGPVFQNGIKTGLSVKCRIRPALDDTNEPVTITGTEWEVMELISPGQNYAVGDVFNIQHTHRHPSGDETTFAIALKVTALAPTTSLSGGAAFDVMIPGDMLNGHLVMRVQHTDLDNFPYHIAYLDERGSAFTKDTQYTSSRNHVITAIAGHGIKDRAFYGGLFEFFDKSIQYTTHSVKPGAPNVWTDIEQPDVSVQITNGYVSGVTINDGGQSWDKLPSNLKKEIQISSPPIVTGKTAKAEGTFTNGVLTAVTITDVGSGYNQDYPPDFWIRHFDPEVTNTVWDGVPDEEDQYNELMQIFRDYSATDKEETALQKKLIDYIINPQDYNPYWNDTYNTREASKTSRDMTIPDPNTEVQVDPFVKRVIDLPQRLYSPSVIAKVRENVVPLDRPMPKEALMENVNQIEIDRSLLDKLDTNLKDAYGAHNGQIQEQLTNITQVTGVPDSITYDENSVRTVQRRFLDMPHASPGTKYYMKQYRSDPRRDIYFTVTLGHDPLETGCGHFTCNAPTPPSDFSTYDGNTDITSTYSYVVSGQVQGPGCRGWSASGQQHIRHHMTKSTNTYSATVAAYGNPF